MEFLRRQWAQVNVGLGELSTEKKLIIGLCLVLMLAVLFLFLAWAGKSSRRALPFVGGRTDEVVATLRGRGIDAEVVDGQISVPADDQQAAVAVLLENDLMTEDPADAWAKLVGEQSPWETREQAEQRSRVAMQNYAAGVIGSMQGVRRARVFVSSQPRTIFGEPYLRRSASVTVWLESRRRLDQPMVEAIAAFIAGGDAQMRALDVDVIDGNNGTVHKVDDPDDVLPTEAIELARQRENEYKEKILELLSIRDLRVAVTVQVDPIAKQQSQETQYEDSPPVAMEESETTTRQQFADAGEPGVRSNLGASIDGASQAQTVEQTESSHTEFGLNKVVKLTDTLIAGHQIRKINVSIGVPRSYFVTLYKARNSEAEGEPDDATLQPIIQQKLVEFEQRISPIIETDTGPGQVVTGVYEDASTLQLAGAEPVAVGLGAVMNSPWAQPALAGGLVLGVLVLMFYMVRRATRPESLPTIEELAGLPPRLQSDDDIVGEVDESESMMAGVELDENELESRKIAEQISELIKANPGEAGSLMSKWVKHDD